MDTDHIRREVPSFGRSRVQGRRRALSPDRLLQDVRFSLRTLCRNPLFTAAAVVSVAVGIGANAAVFAFVHGFLIDPLPFKESHRLVSILATSPSRGVERLLISYPDFLHVREQSRSFSDIAAYGLADITLTGAGEPERLFASNISHNLFDVLGVEVVLGRGLQPEDEQQGTARVAIMNHGLWQSRFGGDPDMLGRTVNLSGEPCTIVGIMQPGFEFPHITQFWLPIQLSRSEGRGERRFRFTGRLGPGVSIEEAQGEMDGIAAGLAEMYPVENGGVGIIVESLRKDLLDDNRGPVLLFYAVVSLVLLLACANVANLLLARGASRQQEIAVRVSLGASRLRIIRQLLTESLMLALAGGAVGLLLGRFGRDLVLAGIPYEIPFYFTFEIDLAVVAILTMITMVCGLLFGLVPALISTKPGLGEVLRGMDGGSTGRLRRSRFRSVLVSVEVGMAVLILIGAGLMIKGFLRMQSMDQGFNPKNILTMEINLGNVGYEDPASRVLFFRDLIDRIRQHPEVESVAAGNPPPYLGWEVGYELEGVSPAEADRSLTAVDAVVTPGYFRTLEIPLLMGRDFDDRDAGPDIPRVVVVSETFARVNWPGEEPLGKRFRLSDIRWADNPWMEVIGVVGDTRVGTFSPPRGWFYRPQGQLAFWELILVIRTSVDPLLMIDHVKQLVWSIEPDLALHWNYTLEDLIRERYWQPPVFSWAFGIFSLLAIILACVGVYGVVAYTVVRRSREFGIRLSVGARPSDVVTLVLRQGGLLAAWGIIGGLAAAFILMQLAAGIFFGVSPTDPAIYMLVTTLMTVVTLLASYVPAWRAAHIDPVRTLREE